jgi:hypothetical protein
VAELAQTNKTVITDVNHQATMLQLSQFACVNTKLTSASPKGRFTNSAAAAQAGGMLPRGAGSCGPRGREIVVVVVVGGVWTA